MLFCIQKLSVSKIIFIASCLESALLLWLVKIFYKAVEGRHKSVNKVLRPELSVMLGFLGHSGKASWTAQTLTVSSNKTQLQKDLCQLLCSFSATNYPIEVSVFIQSIHVHPNDVSFKNSFAFVAYSLLSLIMFITSQLLWKLFKCHKQS